MIETEVLPQKVPLGSQDESWLIRNEITLLSKQNRPRVIRSWVYALVGSLVIFYFFYFFLGYHEIISVSHNTGSIIFLALPLFLPLKLWYELSKQARRIVMERIAMSLGYTYIEKSPLESVLGVIFSQGNSRYLQDIFEGSSGDFSVRLFSYYFTIRRGKRGRTYRDIVFECSYPKQLPHIVLLPESTLNMEHEEVGLFSVAALEKVQLEGNFNSVFDLYVEDSAQTKVREILTPDVMLYLMDVYSAYIIEFNQNKMYLMRRDHFMEPIPRYEINSLGIGLLEKLSPGLRSVTK